LQIARQPAHHEGLHELAILGRDHAALLGDAPVGLGQDPCDRLVAAIDETVRRAFVDEAKARRELDVAGAARAVALQLVHGDRLPAQALRQTRLDGLDRLEAVAALVAADIASDRVVVGASQCRDARAQLRGEPGKLALESAQLGGERLASSRLAPPVGRAHTAARLQLAPVGARGVCVALELGDARLDLIQPDGCGPGQQRGRLGTGLVGAGARVVGARGRLIQELALAGRRVAQADRQGLAADERGALCLGHGAQERTRALEAVAPLLEAAPGRGHRAAGIRQRSFGHRQTSAMGALASGAAK
jgi:hypothetical protein